MKINFVLIIILFFTCNVVWGWDKIVFTSENPEDYIHYENDKSGNITSVNCYINKIANTTITVNNDETGTNDSVYITGGLNFYKNDLERYELTMVVDKINIGQQKQTRGRISRIDSNGTVTINGYKYEISKENKYALSLAYLAFANNWSVYLTSTPYRIRYLHLVKQDLIDLSESWLYGSSFNVNAIVTNSNNEFSTELVQKICNTNYFQNGNLIYIEGSPYRLQNMKENELLSYKLTTSIKNIDDDFIITIETN